MKVNLSNLDTEGVNENTKSIDCESTQNIVEIINKEDEIITKAISDKKNIIAKIIDQIFIDFKKEGRLFYIGAGSSGRIGVLDASEMLPTYGLKDKIIGIIAGGDTALRNPVEDIEDDASASVMDLKKFKFNPNDSLIAIGASGRTPYCIGALKYAKSIGAPNYALCMTSNSEFKQIADITMEIITGPEVICGSTRMKSGTATKMVLNIISTALMIKLGKVYNNLMVDVRANNEKLKKRVFNIVKKITKEKNDEKIIKILEETNFNSKVSIVCLLKNLTPDYANEILEKNNGILKKVIG